MWLDIDDFCCIVRMSIGAAWILSQMDVFPGKKLTFFWNFIGKRNYLTNDKSFFLFSMQFWIWTDSALVQWPCSIVHIGNHMCREHYDWAKSMWQKHNVWLSWSIWYRPFLDQTFGWLRYTRNMFHFDEHDTLVIYWFCFFLSLKLKKTKIWKIRTKKFTQ